jgi:hypothetical protein
MIEMTDMIFSTDGEEKFRIPSPFSHNYYVVTKCPTHKLEIKERKMTINKIKVKETQEYYGDFAGSLESIIASLQADLDAGWEGIGTEYEQYGDHPSPYLYKHREETDKEYDERMKLLEKEKAEKVKWQKRKLKQLKKDLDSLSDADKKLLGL